MQIKWRFYEVENKVLEIGKLEKIEDFHCSRMI